MKAGATRPVRAIGRGWCVASLSLVTACSGSTTTAPLPSAPPVVKVTMRDFAFDYAPPRASGRVVFHVRNEGAIDHQMTVFPLPDDLPPFDEQLHGTQRRFLDTLAQVPPRKPGQTDVLALDLLPGQRYGFVCFLRDPEGRIYGLRGMNSEFRAASAPGS